MTAIIARPGRDPLCAGCDLLVVEAERTGTDDDCGRDWSVPVDGTCWQGDEEGDEE